MATIIGTILFLCTALSVSTVYSAPVANPSVIGELPENLPDDVKIINRRRKCKALHARIVVVNLGDEPEAFCAITLFLIFYQIREACTALGLRLMDSCDNVSLSFLQMSRCKTAESCMTMASMSLGSTLCNQMTKQASLLSTVT